jgi:Rrf2 family protein
MKTTKTVAYALACLQKLAEHAGEYVQACEIALAQEIPQAYCQKILLALSNAGIVESVKGRGFMLLKPFESITTLEVLQALENPREEKPEDPGDRSQAIHEILSSHLAKLMAGLTIAEVLHSVR